MPVRLHFADCVFDTDLRELRRGDRVVPLSPKTFHLLEILLARRPAAVTHADLRQALWPGAVAGGTTLARLVADLREAVGDDAGAPRIIRTVHRFGYAFCGTALAEQIAGTGQACCALEWGPRLIPLPEGVHLIGRAADALISVASPRVSRRHAQIVVTAGGATLEDLDSTNGTYLDGERIGARVELKDQNQIVVGPVTLIFHASIEDDRTSV